MADAIWKSSKGDVKVSDMATAHIKNAITVVEAELKSGVTKGESILEHLKAEFAKRPAAEQADTSNVKGATSTTTTA
jgi:hypothetical protein